MLANVEAAGAADTPDDAILAAELNSEGLIGRIAMPFMLTTFVALWLLFRGSADPRWLANLWVMIGLLMMAAGVYIGWRFHNASATDAGPTSRMRRIIQVCHELTFLLLAAAPWMLMAGADPVVQALGLATIPLFLAVMQFGALNVRFVTRAYRLPQAGILVAAASEAAFALVEGLPHAWSWAAFLLMSGGLLFVLRDLAQRTVMAELDRRVALETAAADTRQALAVAAAERDAKARFVASASHDLKQPLATAQLWARMGLDAEPGEARARAIDNAERAFASAITQLDSMLHHVRLEAGAELVRIRTVPLAPILQAAADAHGPATQAAGMRIIVAPSRRLVVADPALLARALDNLIVNAIRHSGARRLLLGARASGEGVSIWAIDDGRGIAPADRGRLFLDYAQGSDAAPGGFGIGLASVRRLLQLMGGDAMFDPRWARGAAFRLSLPQAPPLPTPAPATAP